MALSRQELSELTLQQLKETPFVQFPYSQNNYFLIPIFQHASRRLIGCKISPMKEVSFSHNPNFSIVISRDYIIVQPLR